jgi:TonB family protein
MEHGKEICRTLKQVRLDIARANGIEYVPAECHYQGECLGTCPACEGELRYLEQEIARKRSLGKAALIAGVSLAVSSLSAIAGNSPSGETMDYSNQSQVSDTTKRVEFFGSCEQMPHFPGGERALMKYLQENVKYPPEAVKDSIQGRVVVQFIVDSLGYVGEVKVARSVHELLDEEAVRVCKTLPRFAPGRSLGKAISVWYTLPVTFKLQDMEKTESTEK